MPASNKTFEKTYEGYLSALNRVDFKPLKERLGLTLYESGVEIPLFDDSFMISSNGITDSYGQRAPHEVCVVLSRYILLCPDPAPEKGELASYRDFRDSGPLTVYFENDVEGAIADSFSSRLDELEKACGKIGGKPGKIEVKYDLCFTFDALPRIPLVLLFNDLDEEFPAGCSVLFQSSAVSFLDPECLAMIGRLLYIKLAG